MSHVDELRALRITDSAGSPLEELFALHVRAMRLPKPEREFRFDSERKWRADFAWPDIKLIVEVEGGTASGGRHVRPDGFERDCEKYNAATLSGWRVLRVTSKMINSGAAVLMLMGVFEGERNG